MNSLPDIENDYPTILRPSDAESIISLVIDISKCSDTDYSKYDFVETIAFAIHKTDLPPKKILKRSTIKKIIDWIDENWVDDANFQDEAIYLMFEIEENNFVLSFLENKTLLPTVRKEYAPYFRTTP